MDSGFATEAAYANGKVTLVVRRALVKSVKSALEGQGKYDKRQKIRPAPQTGQGGDTEYAFFVPTTKPLAIFWPRWCAMGPEAAFAELLQEFNLTAHAADIELVGNPMEHKPSWSAVDSGVDRSCQQPMPLGHKNLLARTIGEWSATLPEEILSLVDRSEHGELVCTPTYMIYQPMLLLPPNFFSTWPSIFLNAAFPKHAPALYSLLCRTFHVTHVALNAPISPVLPLRDAIATCTEHGTTHSNISRSPTNFTPLYGSFGPLLPLCHHPTTSDFNQAFWCSARQNSILQTWAPRYTMFSRGNITEKARVLNLSSLTEGRLGCPPAETCAVDLYAGIGYFAFSYAKAGVGNVLCWEINPWSAEGLRRGVRGNGWNVTTIGKGDEAKEGEIKKTRMIMFQENNEHAVERVAAIRCWIPPVRHVNCGLLPDCRGSWKTALQVLDPLQGGWIHAHENIAKKDIGTRTQKIVSIFDDIIRDLYGPVPGMKPDVSCEHVEQVKSYAPSVMHCVLDIAIAPIKTSV
ncbi:MAG: hypothetical protein Q9163_000516 [Psora crenata]